MLRLILVPALAYLAVLVCFVMFQRRLVFVLQPSTALTPRDFGAPFSEVSITTPDGFSLSAWWLEHAEPSDSRITLLYSHGNAANLSGLAEVAGIFYSWGWNVLLYDYRAYGSSSGTHADLSEVAVGIDAQSAYDWLKQRGIPEGRIVMWGHSLGSSVTARLASRNKPAGVVLEGAFPEIYQVARRHYPWLLITRWMLRDRFETAKYIAGHTYPILFIHAGRDEVVPLDLGQRVHAQTNGPKDWMLVDGIAHNGFPSVHERYSGAITSRVATWLKP